jgi:hypothetical protein
VHREIAVYLVNIFLTLEFGARGGVGAAGRDGRGEGQGWAGLGWAGLGWAGLGWAGLVLGGSTADRCRQETAASPMPPGQGWWRGLGWNCRSPGAVYTSAGLEVVSASRPARVAMSAIAMVLNPHVRTHTRAGKATSP